MMTFIKKYLWVVIIIISLILVPQSLNIQSELNMRIIVTAIGVDFSDDKYEVTAQVVRPSDGSTAEGGSAGLDFISAKADTVAEAMYKVSFLLGKTAGLGHVNTICFGKSVVDGNLAIPTIDYFLRDARIPTSCLLVVCDGESSEELKKTKALELSNAVGIQKLYLYKEQSMNGTMIQLERFVNDYYKIGSTSIISGMKFEDESSSEGSSGSGSGEGQGGGSSSSGSGGEGSTSGSGGSEEKPKQRIAFNNKVYLFKNGNKVFEFDEDNGVKGLNYANSKSKSGIISLNNISDDEYYDNARVSVFVRDKKVSIDAYFDGDTPICKMRVKTSRNEVIEIDNASGEKFETLYIQRDFLTKKVEEKIKEEMEKEIKNTFNLAKEANADVFHLGDELYSKNPKKWKKFIQKYGENYVSHINFDVCIEIDKRF